MLLQSETKIEPDLSLAAELKSSLAQRAGLRFRGLMILAVHLGHLSLHNSALCAKRGKRGILRQSLKQGMGNHGMGMGKGKRRTEKLFKKAGLPIVLFFKKYFLVLEAL